MPRPLLTIENDCERDLQPEEFVALRASLGGDSLDQLTPDTTGRIFELSFYEDVNLVELSDPSWEPKGVKVYFLLHDNKFFLLEGTAPQIHAMNAKVSLTLTESTVLEYLAFFCFFVRGEFGPFLVVDRLENRFLPAIKDNEILDTLFRSPKVWGRSEDGALQASALVFHGEQLFFSDFLIMPDGMIEMIEDDALTSSLDAQVNAPILLVSSKSIP